MTSASSAASSFGRFSMPHVWLIKKDESFAMMYKPNKRLPSTEGDVNITFSGGILHIEEGVGCARVFPAHQDPLASVASFGLSVLAFPLLLRENDDPLILVIKRSKMLSTFPGMLAFPGGFMDPHDGLIYSTAVRELKEETGDAWFSYLVVKDVVGIIDSIPLPNRHNMTVLQVVHVHLKDGDTVDDALAKTIAQTGEIESIHFFTLSQLREHNEECTPGLQKMLACMNITKDGRIEWN